MKNLSFEEYCSEFFDLHVALLSEQEKEECLKSYKQFIAKQSNNNKNKKALNNAADNRKLAKQYGGKALKGSAKQKSWAEKIRQQVLASENLSDDKKERLMKLGGFVDHSKFWINNKDKPSELFDPDNILSEYNRLIDLYNKHHDTLARTTFVHEKEQARKEIYGALCSMSIFIKVDFPNFDFYDNWGNLKR